MIGSAKPAKIVLDGFPSAGATEARVVMVIYACARCPLCVSLTPRLRQLVVEGPLSGKVRLVYKPFPIRSHAHAKLAALAQLAAARLGRFWEFCAVSGLRFDSFAPEVLRAWAIEAGLDADRFSALLNSEELVELLLASKTEGLRNRVAATPTLFINGHRYHGDLDLDELADVLAEEVDRIAGVVYLGVGEP